MHEHILFVNTVRGHTLKRFTDAILFLIANPVKECVLWRHYHPKGIGGRQFALNTMLVTIMYHLRSFFMIKLMLNAGWNDIIVKYYFISSREIKQSLFWLLLEDQKTDSPESRI